MTQRERNTKEMLLALSKRLSSRKTCRDKEYKLVIEPNGNYIFTPSVIVYPDHEHVADCYQCTPMQFILKHQFPKFANYAEADSVTVDTSLIVPGTYLFQYNSSHTRRQWIAIIQDKIVII